MKLALLEALQAARARKAPVAVVTRLDDGDQRLLDVESDTDDPLLESAWEAVRTDRSLSVSDAGHEYFIQPFNPPVRLFVVGAVHVAQALVPMAQLAGYEVTVIDPRQAFATAERFPGCNLVVEWPGRALETLAPDRRSAVVVLSHDPKIDDPALKAALATEAFYVGALGSRRTHSQRLERLAGDGLSKAQLAHIHAPIGLDIGGRSPGEIAVSIVAEMTQTLRKGRPE